MPLTPSRLRIPNLVLTLLRELHEYSQQDLADRLTEEAVDANPFGMGARLDDNRVSAQR